MPLTPVYTWSETETSILLTVNNVPIKDQNQIFCSDRVVKLNAPPYLLLLDLKNTIDDERSVATVSQGRNLTFQLIKTEPGLWGSLVADGDKKAIRQLREESMHRAQQKQVAAQKQRLERKNKEEKAAISHQIETEKKQRKRLEALKQQELEQERQQLQAWQQHLPSSAHPQLQESCNTHGAPAGDESDYEDEMYGNQAAVSAGNEATAASSVPDNQLQDVMPDHPDYYGKGWHPSKSTTAQPAASVTATSAASNTVDESSSGDNTAHHSTDTHGQAAILKVDSSRRPGQSVMQTLVSQASAAAATDIWDAVPTHSNSKADSVQAEQLLTEVSTKATRSAPRPHQHAVQQPTAAVPPPKPQAPVRCMAEPVPVSFTQLQTQHLPAREQREIEIKKIKRQDKNDSMDISDRQPAFLKDKGDALAAQGNYRAAINAYSRAIELDPNQPALWSNRAACHLALGAAADCEQDCSAAINLLQAMHARLAASGAATVTAAGEEMLAGMLPPAVKSTAAVAVVDAAATIATAATAADLEGSVEPAEGVQGEHRAASKAEDASSMAAVAGASEGVVNDRPDVLEKLQQQLVKVLARRAAARVELQLLQEAADDLQQALRLDPDNVELKADALEVEAGLHPAAAADPAALKQRADARFKAGDMQGATEAYTAIIELLEHQRQQKEQQITCVDAEETDITCVQVSPEGNGKKDTEQQLLLAVLSNRSACWLSLESYQSCITDCHAALELALERCKSSQNVVSCTSSAGGVCSSTPHEGLHVKDAATTVLEGSSRQADHSTAAQAQRGDLSQLLQQLELQPVQVMLAAAGASRVRSVARLLGRLAVAYGCLKQLYPAVQLYDSAKGYWQALGDKQRVADLAADQSKLQQLLVRDHTRS